MGSTTYDLVYMSVDDRRDFDLLLTYKPHGAWVVTSIEVKRNEVTLPSLGKTYADVTYTLKIAPHEN
ncbi:hypothetical protein ACOMHN_033386 [Nucella lapillus]